MERAIALDSKMCDMMGAAAGKAIKEQAAIGQVDARAAAALARRAILESLGITSDVIQEDAGHTISKIGRCPLYEAAQELGMDGATTEAMRRASALRYMDAMVKQWNPNLSYRLREFRASADGHCIEEVVFGWHEGSRLSIYGLVEFGCRRISTFDSCNSGRGELSRRLSFTWLAYHQPER